MKKFFGKSFRVRLFAGFLAASLLPLLLSSAMLLKTFRLRLDRQGKQETAEQLARVTQLLDTLYTSFRQVSEALKNDPSIAPVLMRGQGGSTTVYSTLFAVTEGSREYARFDLYDKDGIWLYSTQNGPAAGELPVNWGVLYASRQTAGLAFAAAGAGGNTARPGFALAGAESDPARPGSASADAGASGVLLRGAAQITTGEGEAAGYLVITMDRTHLNRLLGGSYGNQNDLILLNPYWRPVYASDPSLAGTLVPRLRSLLLEGADINDKASEDSYGTAYLPDLELYVLLSRPQTLNRDTRTLLGTVTLGSALVCVILSIFLGLKLSRRMFSPIKRLQGAIGQVVHNDLSVRVTPSHDDELGELSRQFNTMVEALKQNQEQLLANHRELNEAQIRMLQAQLNPHFLCNTLDTMKWISKIHQVPQVAVMSTDLADILRFCISPEEFVPLRQEVEILKRYVEIQTIRMSGSFRFAVELPEELAECEIPKMILQPLVENAILHGLEDVTDGAVTVEVRSTSDKQQVWSTPDKQLKICISDNGRGLPKEMEGPYVCREQSSSRHHLGLYNVDTILKKNYGAQYGLHLSRRPDGTGTAVTATLPLTWEEPKNA